MGGVDWEGPKARGDGSGVIDVWNSVELDYEERWSHAATLTGVWDKTYQGVVETILVVAKNPDNRCSKESDDGLDGYSECPAACGTC